MSRSTISVVIPCFNSGAYLGETLDSVLSQTRKADEIIVVDDGSTDPQTQAALQKLPRGVKLIRQQNQGPGAARNAGIRAATSELVLPLDSDDVIVPRALELYERALLADPGASFACSHFTCFGAVDGDFPVPGFNGYLELEDNHIVSTALLHRRLFTELGLWYPDGGYEDWSFWLSCVAAGLQGTVVEERLFKYRRKSGEGVLFQHNATQQRFRHALRERHAELYSAEGRARIKSRYAPGLEILWHGGARRPELDAFLSRQTLTDVVVTDGGAPDARTYLQGARGKYAVEFGEADLERLATARPSFLEQVLRLLDSRPEVSAVVVPVDPPTIFAARETQRVRRYPKEREPQQGDVVFFRVGSARNATRLSVPSRMALAELFRSPIRRNRALLCAFEFFGSAGDAPLKIRAERALEEKVDPRDDQIIWQSPARHLKPMWRAARAAAVVVLGEDATAQRIHGLKVRIEEMLVRRPPRSLREATPGNFGLLLPESRRLELTLLDRVPVRFDRLAPIAASAGKKRVAIVLPWITTGGVDRGAIDVASLLPKDKYELMLITSYPSRHEWEHRMIPHLFDAIHLGDCVPQNEQVARVVEIVRDRSVDAILMSNSWLGYESAMALKRRLPRVRTTDLQHTDFQMKGGDFARQSCERYDRYLDLRMVTHNYLRNRYVGYGADASKIRVVYMSCDDQGEFNPENVPTRWLYERLKLPYNAVLVGFLGRLVKDKNPVFVTQVYAALQRQWTDPSRPLHFVFVGEGPLEKAIQKEAATQGISRQIHFLPADTPMPLAMRDLSLVLMASRIEGLPFVFFEAMSLHVPVVTTDIEGIPELVDAEVGACVPNLKDDLARLDALRNAALPILEDEQMRQQMGLRARQKVLEMCSREYTRGALTAAFADLFATTGRPLSLAAND